MKKVECVDKGGGVVLFIFIALMAHINHLFPTFYYQFCHCVLLEFWMFIKMLTSMRKKKEKKNRVLYVRKRTRKGM